MNVLTTIYIVLLSLGMLAVAMVGGHTVELMQWQLLTTVVSLLSHIWIVRSLLQGTSWSLRWNQQKARAVGGYSLMMWLNTLGSTLFSRGDRLIVGSLLGSQMLGVYAAITDVTSQINSFSALPVQPLLPSLSNLTGQQDIDRRQLKKQVKQATQINGLVALGMGATLITLAPLIVRIFFDNQTTSEHITLFCIGTAIYTFYSCHAVGYYSLLATKAVKTCALIQLLGSLSSLLLIALGAYKFGLIGAILGNSGYLTTFLVTVFGMKSLSIRASYWFKWLLFPLSWFSIVLLISFISPNNYIVLSLIFLIQNLAILAWLSKTNKNSFNMIIKKYANSKK